MQSQPAPAPLNQFALFFISYSILWLGNFSIWAIPKLYSYLRHQTLLHVSDE